MRRAQRIRGVYLVAVSFLLGCPADPAVPIRGRILIDGRANCVNCTVVVECDRRGEDSLAVKPDGSFFVVTASDFGGPTHVCALRIEQQGRELYRLPATRLTAVNGTIDLGVITVNTPTPSGTVPVQP